MDNQFRDSISLIDKKSGDREWVYPKKPSGKFYRWRTWFSWGLMAVLFITPWLRINGHPVLMLNVLERKFIIFGIPFWAQDFPLLALLLLTFIVFIIVFTVLFGRLWCGWACPQTVFMEMLFRKIEYMIEGDYKAQKKLAAQEWNTEKIIKKSVKHVLFFVLSFAIANTFLAYLIGTDELRKLMTEGVSAHVGQFISLLIFTTVFYLVFSRIREIVCIVICPYGRLQGLMLDRNSIVVAYDFVRGEPRGFRKKNVTQNLGACVDCNRCVQVCPTGIDIRNGTQLECINCTACIDECHDVMQKTHQPTGLIRYASQQEVVTKSKKRITLRSGAYVVILVALTALLTFLLVTRKPIEVTVLRTPGMLYQEQGNNRVSNLYNFEVVNKTFDVQDVNFEIVSPANAEIKMVDRESSRFKLNEDDLVKGSFFIIIPQREIKTNNIKTEIEILCNGKTLDKKKINFVAPVK